MPLFPQAPQTFRTSQLETGIPLRHETQLADSVSAPPPQLCQEGGKGKAVSGNAAKRTQGSKWRGAPRGNGDRVCDGGGSWDLWSDAQGLLPPEPPWPKSLLRLLHRQPLHQATVVLLHQGLKAGWAHGQRDVLEGLQELCPQQLEEEEEIQRGRPTTLDLRGTGAHQSPAMVPSGPTCIW